MTKFTLLFLCLSSFAFAFAGDFKISKDGDNYTLTVPDSAQAEIKKVVPGFVLWTVKDFHPVAIKSMNDRYKPNTAPFALVDDFNGDKIPDAILSGHDGKENHFVSVLSKGKSFVVKKESSYDHTKESRTVSWDKVKASGQTFLLRLGGNHSWSVGEPQTDEMHDGSYTTFEFKAGKFVEEAMGPL